MKDRFLANINLEIRAPLYSVLIMAETLNDKVYGLHNDRQHRCVKAIQKSGQQLFALVSNMVNFLSSSHLASAGLPQVKLTKTTLDSLSAPSEHPDPPHILLAEDNIESQENLLEYLESKGYRVVTANNGREAVEQAQRYLPRVILMDVQMPEVDGLEAIRWIRANPLTANLYIIALTALAMVGDRDRCLSAGADEYITKPMQLKQLLGVIRPILNRSTG